MGKWEMVKLGEVCDVRDGTHDSPKYQEKGYPLITSKNIIENEIDFSNVNLISFDDFKKINKRSKVDVGDILMPMIGTIGNSMIVNISNEFAIKNVALIKFNNATIYNKFVNYILKSSLFERYVAQENRGGTQKFLSLSNIRDFKIPLPPLEEQQKIAKNLDIASELVTLYKTKLEELDKLIQSVFYTMFGDPVTNEKEFEIETGKELFVFSSGKFLSAEKRRKTGIPAYGGNGIAFFTDEHLIDYNTIIIGRVGAYCGNIKKTAQPVWITDNAIYIKQFKSEVYNIDFLYYLMLNINFYKFADFSGQPKITQKPLENSSYLLPPLPLQQKFANTVTKIEQQKTETNKALANAQMLYNSLMQQYFK